MYYKHTENTDFVSQSGKSFRNEDFDGEFVTGLRIGIVLNVLRSNDRQNVNSISGFGRTNIILADVAIVDSAIDQTFYIESDVIILPSGRSNYWDYSEELPKPVFKQVDDTDRGVISKEMNHALEECTLEQLDGDWCVIGYIGNCKYKPVMLSFFPNPANIFDPATVGEDKSIEGSPAMLTQESRWLKRSNGTLFLVTDTGSVLIDTTHANSQTTITDGERTENDVTKGGSVQLDLKKGQQFEITYRGNAEGIVEESLVPQEGTFGSEVYPHKQPVQKVASRRSEDGSYINFNNDQLTIGAKTVVGGTGDPLVLGDKLYDTLTQLVGAINTSNTALTALCTAMATDFIVTAPATAAAATSTIAALATLTSNLQNILTNSVFRSTTHTIEDI